MLAELEQESRAIREVYRRGGVQCEVGKSGTGIPPPTHFPAEFNDTWRSLHSNSGKFSWKCRRKLVNFRSNTLRIS